MANDWKKLVHGETNGYHGGLSLKTVQDICLLLDVDRDGGNNWIQLADRLFHTDCLTTELAGKRITRPTKEILHIFFQRCIKDRKPDKEAVCELVRVLEELKLDAAVEIISDDASFPARIRLP